MVRASRESTVRSGGRGIPGDRARGREGFAFAASGGDGGEHDVVSVVSADRVEGATAGDKHEPWGAGSGVYARRQGTLEIRAHRNDAIGVGAPTLGRDLYAIACVGESEFEERERLDRAARALAIPLP
jgi:hypothetical protein